MFTKLTQRAKALAAEERGDVPGWVLITLMTAALVMVLWAVAGPAIQAMVQQALTGISFS